MMKKNMLLFCFMSNLGNNNKQFLNQSISSQSFSLFHSFLSEAKLQFLSIQLKSIHQIKLHLFDQWFVMEYWKIDLTQVLHLLIILNSFILYIGKHMHKWMNQTKKSWPSNNNCTKYYSKDINSSFWNIT